MANPNKLNLNVVLNANQVHPKVLGRNLRQWLEVKSKKDLHQVLTEIETQVKQGHLAWRFIGDRENNLGSINQIQKPESGLVENISNAMDAVIQFRIDQGGGVDSKGKPFNSPNEVIENYFQSTLGGSKFKRKSKTTTKNLTTLRENLLNPTRHPLVSVTFQSQDSYYSHAMQRNRDSVTIDIQDRGCGIRWDQLDKTILQLQSDTKTKDPRFIGKYGQGGSTALSQVSHEGASMIVTSHHQSPDYASLTLIKREVHGRNHSFKYLIDAHTGHPIVLSKNKNEATFILHGTLIRHFGYELDSRDMVFYTKAKQTKTCLYNTLNEIIVDPVIPFRIYDGRVKQTVRSKTSGAGAPITGALPRIDKAVGHRSKGQVEDDIVYLSVPIPLDLSDKGSPGLGKVTLQYAIAGYRKDLEGTGKVDPYVKNFALAGEIGKFHLSGSAVSGVPTKYLREATNFPFLTNYTLMYIKLDDLPDITLGTVIQGNRETISEAFLERVMEAAIKEYNQDGYLPALNEALSHRGTSENVSEGIQDRLRKDFGKMFRGSSDKSNGSSYPKQADTAKKLEGVAEFKYHPTIWEFLNSTEKTVSADTSFSLQFKTDVFPEKMMMTIPDPTNPSELTYQHWTLKSSNPNIDVSKVTYVGKGSSVEGLGIFTGLRVHKDSLVGEESSIEVSYFDNKSLKGKAVKTAWTKVRVVPKVISKNVPSQGMEINLEIIDRDMGGALGMTDANKHLSSYVVNEEANTFTVYISSFSNLYKEFVEGVRKDNRGNPSEDLLAEKVEKFLGEYYYMIVKESILYYIASKEAISPLSAEDSEEDSQVNPMTAYENRIMGSASTSTTLLLKHPKIFNL